MELKKIARPILVVGLTVATSSAMGALISVTNNPGLGIVDNTTVSDTISVGDSGNLTSLTVDVAIDHTWVGDLTLTLESDGISVTLMDRPGNPDTTFGFNSDLLSSNPISFDDADGGANPAESIGSGGTPIPSGTFTPENPLGNFSGIDIMGDWILSIQDSAGGDQGTLASWTLNFNTGDGGSGQVPEPATLGLFGLGLLGFGLARRKRRA